LVFSWFYILLEFFNKTLHIFYIKINRNNKSNFFRNDNIWISYKF
jgi:hypothetical protein